MAKEQVAMLSINSMDDVVAMHTIKLSQSIDAVLAWAVQAASLSQSDMALALLQRMKVRGALIEHDILGPVSGICQIATSKAAFAAHPTLQQYCISTLFVSWPSQQPSFLKGKQCWQAVLLEADQQRARAEVEGRIAKAEVAGLAHRAAIVEMALERRTTEWEATKLQYHLLQKGMSRHVTLASSHHQQLAALQVSWQSVAAWLRSSSPTAGYWTAYWLD